MGLNQSFRKNLDLYANVVKVYLIYPAEGYIGMRHCSIANGKDMGRIGNSKQCCGKGPARGGLPPPLPSL
jgi:hypothetical protein